MRNLKAREFWLINNKKILQALQENDREIRSHPQYAKKPASIIQREFNIGLNFADDVLLYAMEDDCLKYKMAGDSLIAVFELMKHCTVRVLTKKKQRLVKPEGGNKNLPWAA